METARNTLWRWTNQYMDKCHSKPELLVSFEQYPHEEELLTPFHSRCEKYQQLHCELGFGSGGYLLGRAKAQPDRFYFGFEKRFKRAFRAAEKAEKDNLQNVFFLRADATHLWKLLGERKLDSCCINFPDPWARKRWRKHRMVNAEFLASLSESLKDSGHFQFKTDHREYFITVAALIREKSPFHIVEYSENFHGSEYDQEKIYSEFELLFRSQRAPVHYFRAVL